MRLRTLPFLCYTTWTVFRGLWSALYLGATCTIAIAIAIPPVKAKLRHRPRDVPLSTCEAATIERVALSICKTATKVSTTRRQVLAARGNSAQPEGVRLSKTKTSRATWTS